MHAEYKNLFELNKVATSTYGGIKRMTVRHKSEAIKFWCEVQFDFGEVLPNVKLPKWDTVNEAIFVGCVSSVGATEDGGWTWKNLMEWGLRTIVMEIGTEDEIERAKRGLMFYDELSLKTLQKLPAFEKKIYDDYKEECQRKWYVTLQNAKLKVVESKAEMSRLEMLCMEREYVLGDNNVEREWRDYWSLDRKVFATGRTIL